jgi:hypothetical protein
MGAGILPTTIHNGTLYFLFGKENKYADTPGYSDFGGGTDNNESFFKTAVREGGEELTGFLGSDKELTKMLKKHGTYNIDWSTSGQKPYRLHIFPMEYNLELVKYYNNNQRFLQKNLDPSVIQKVKIFEKGEIEWFSLADMKRRKKEFRSYFQEIVDRIYSESGKIETFIKRGTSKTRKNRK